MNDVSSLFDEALAITKAAVESDVDAMLVIDPHTLRSCITDWLRDRQAYRGEVFPSSDGACVSYHKDSSADWISQDECLASLDSLMQLITENAE